MSRWWPEQVVLRIGDRAPVAEPTEPAGVLPPLEAVRAQTGGGESASRLDVWMNAFEDQLKARSARRFARLTVVLAGEAVRYQIVPWTDALSQPAERQVVAEQCFAQAYGDQARGWTVRQHIVQHGEATLACAVDSALLDRLDAAARTRQLKLASVQPALMLAYNRIRRRIRRGPHWFVVVEGGWTTLLLVSATGPLQVKHLPSADADLARLLDREWAALGLEAPRCPVYVDTAAPLPSGLPTERWQVVDLAPLAHQAA